MKPVILDCKKLINTSKIDEPLYEMNESLFFLCNYKEIVCKRIWTVGGKGVACEAIRKKELCPLRIGSHIEVRSKIGGEFYRCINFDGRCTQILTIAGFGTDCYKNRYTDRCPLHISHHTDIYVG